MYYIENCTKESPVLRSLNNVIALTGYQRDNSRRSNLKRATKASKEVEQKLRAERVKLIRAKIQENTDVTLTQTNKKIEVYEAITVTLMALNCFDRLLKGQFKKT